MKRVLFAAMLGFACLTTTCSANGIPTNVTNGRILSQDEISISYEIDGGIARVDTRSGSVMEVDISEPGQTVNGLTIGQEFNGIQNFPLIATTEHEGHYYYAYDMGNNIIFRVTVEDRLVKELSMLVNV